MKKRLRKKKRRGEFRVMGFRVAFRMPSGLSVKARNAVLNRFVDEAMEGNGLVFGGGEGADKAVWEGVATLGKGGSATLEHREKVGNWLRQEPRVVSYWMGEMVDAWNGPWPESAGEEGWTQKET